MMVMNRSFGAVFNTDDSNGPGEHWFSVYVDLKGVNRKKINLDFIILIQLEVMPLMKLKN